MRARKDFPGTCLIFETKRTRLAQAFTLCLLLVSWALTIGSIYITLLIVFRTEETDDAVLLFPVTIVLTVPTLRSLDTGSSPFGIVIGKYEALRS
jgi:hypothetical protein